MLKSDNYNLRIVSAALFIPLLVEGITVMRGGVNGLITTFIYMGFLGVVLCIVFNRIRAKDLFVLAGIYSFFIVNILLFPSTIDYYKDKAMMMTVVFYLPICTFVVNHIKNWNGLFKEMKLFAAMSVPIALYMVIFSDITQYEELFTYMDFSYCLLPFVAALYLTGREERSNLWYTLFAIDALCMILYGARATFLFLVIFIAGYEYLHGSSRFRIYLLGAIFITAVIATLFYADIIIYLSTIDGIKESRLVEKALIGQLTDGGDRERLVLQSMDRISTMGAEIPGLYGDRKYIQGVYPHNIVLEILMQFGIIGGSLILILFMIIVKVDIFDTRYGIPALFLCCILFGKFMFSGSYIQDGLFWLWLFAMICIFQSRKRPLPSNIKTTHLIST